MKCRHLMLLFYPLAVVSLVAAQDKPTSPGGKPAADAKPRDLFDGKSLTNWKRTEFGGEGEVKIDDGRLVIGRGQPLTGVTWNGGQLPKVNYELTLEAQRVEGSDFFVGLTFPVKDKPCSLILGGWGGSLTGLSSINGFDASENETTNFYKFDNGKWYKVRVRVTDTHIQAWLDDTNLADVDHSDKKIGIRIEMELSKPLGLATYNTQAAIRNFKLRELPEGERKPEKVE
jgi:hypothetical protein